MQPLNLLTASKSSLKTIIYGKNDKKMQDFILGGLGGTLEASKYGTVGTVIQPKIDAQSELIHSNKSK